jgi:hypothetical protein
MWWRCIEISNSNHNRAIGYDGTARCLLDKYQNCLIVTETSDWFGNFMPLPSAYAAALLTVLNAKRYSDEKEKS